jgi:beta-barrel assembly-enhancing protease
MRIWKFGLAGVALVAGAQQKGINFYSVEKEIQVGAQQARVVAAKTTPLNNPVASAYVVRIVRELVRQIPDSKFRYVLAIVKEPMGAEPDVLMGGYIFVSAGLLQAAQNESEFVGILAHAMAHVVDRDASRDASRAEMFQIATTRLAQNTTVALQRDSLNTQFELQKRMYEKQADALAAKILAAAGYSPSGLAAFVERNAKDDNLPGWQDFHAKRVAAIREGAAQATVAAHADDGEFTRARDATGK